MNHLLTLVAANVGIGWGRALSMYVRRSLTRDLVFAIIVASKADFPVSIESLEAHSLAGGDPLAVVNALLLLHLDEAGEPQDFERLAAFDLAGRDLPGITEAYSKARERFPDLTFTEILTRQGQGEDVVASIADGTFVPRSQLGGWRVRLELGPLTFDELRNGVASGEFPDGSLVQDPESGEWLPIQRIIDSV